MFDFSQYMPHGMCLLWQPWLVSLWVGADLLIFTAYMAIPFAIGLVLRRRPDLAHQGVVILFASFILLCGVTHAMSIVNLWYPIYPITGAVKLVTGIASMLTAIALFRLIPVFVRIPNPDRHEEVIEQLEVALADLSHARSQLEQRVKRRTSELNAANQRLARSARETVHRNHNLVHIVAELVQSSKEASAYPEAFLRELRGRINALVEGTRAIMEQDDRTVADLQYIIWRQIESILGQAADRLALDGPSFDIGSQGAQQLSLITHELATRFAQMGRAEQSRGRITVSWAVHQQSGREAEFTFEWCESFGADSADALNSGVEGDGTYTPEPLSSFSETLLRQIVPHLLGGKGRIEIAPATFIYRLTCPLGAIKSAGATVTMGAEAKVA